MVIYDLKTMQICDIREKTSVALGTFDGGHIGHASVLQSARRLALANKVKSVVYTFSTIPSKKVVENGAMCLFSLEEKLKFFRSNEIDYVAIDDFDDVCDIDGIDFMKSVLKDKLNAVYASCGFNFRFGKGASSSPSDLSSFFENQGGSVSICDCVYVGNQVISSSYIRELVKNGEVEKILECAPPYSIISKVEHGKELGRTIGIPTINQKIPKEKLVPKRGVYITECEIGEDVYPSITNVGVRPTTDGYGAEENMETHIIGYSGNLYSSYIRVNFYKYERDEKKFSSVDELKEVVFENIKSAKKYFGLS